MKGKKEERMGVSRRSFAALIVMLAVLAVGLDGTILSVGAQQCHDEHEQHHDRACVDDQLYRKEKLRVEEQEEHREHGHGDHEA